jgi:spoIIIJ-associated protein
MSNEIEKEGKTVTIAVENGLKELNLSREDVEVQVLDEGNAGFLGIGAKLARVRIRRKHWEGEKGGNGEPDRKPAAAKREPKPAKAVRSAPKSAKRPARRDDGPVDTDKACSEAKSLLAKILELAGVANAVVRTEWDSEQHRVKAEIESEDGGLLIGKGGRTLESLQFLTTVILGRKLGSPTAVQVETEGYWQRVEEKILSETKRAVAHVKEKGGAYRFEPMEPSLRRLIHRELTDHPEVETASEGEGSQRRVVVKKRRR